VVLEFLAYWFDREYPLLRRFRRFRTEALLKAIECASIPRGDIVRDKLVLDPSSPARGAEAILHER
jgi:hypothetical protein